MTWIVVCSFMCGVNCGMAMILAGQGESYTLNILGALAVVPTLVKHLAGW